ncbi:shikimate kinase [uncultured Desulfuromonas sp.]|uniref:shikimate kinase n=1 Tax=uncultured Desulfuromonas sp. TaxID=181013 RepID=UPI002633FAD6|nr:shikimate kinase [uncultured Desulfuromonas sp.]
MNIVLIGYRGTGKSAAGHLVAARLGMPCIGLDAEIVKKAGMSIPEIVELKGWTAFRDIESERVREFAGRDNVVIDAGGGIIERPENTEALQGSSRIFWLKASVETIVARIEGDTERPSLTAGKTFTEEVTEVLERRTPLYEAAAQHAIDTDGLTPEQVADRIVALWRKG